jgi:hypothetical protein
MRQRRSSRPNPVAVVIGSAFAIGIAILVLPPVIRFVVFLMSGNIWRTLCGVALISLFVGLGLAAVIGFFERGQPSETRGETTPRRKGRIWMLAWVFLLVTPVCLIVALVASGALVDCIQWSGDRISEIRDAQSSS